ncbi:MAG TPA: ATP-binding protein [Acidobacteriota bacterium]|nr:ATP-binding protein [Acidobacteriota bacterium]
MANPFTIGIARKDNFCNRQKELKDLTDFANSGQDVVLYSPRRYGKSSLVFQVFRELEKKGFLTVYVDLFPISSEADLISRFAASVIKGIGQGADPRTFKERIMNLFSSLIPSFEVKPDGLSISVKFDRSTKKEVLLDDLMKGMYNFVKRKKLRACISLDEFQEITELPESKSIEGILRSHMQLHKEIAYFFIGSRRRIIKDIFTDKNRPFYKSAFLYTLKDIPKHEFVNFLENKFKETGKNCPINRAEEIYDRTEGYPYYVQKLALLIWNLTEKIVTSEAVQRAYRLLLESEAADFEGIWNGLSLGQKSVLKAIANEPTAFPFSKQYLERYGYSAGGAQKAIKALISKDLIQRDEENRYRLTDPIMAKWLTL